MSWRKKDGGSVSAIISELVGSVVVGGFVFLGPLSPEVNFFYLSENHPHQDPLIRVSFRPPIVLS